MYLGLIADEGERTGSARIQIVGGLGLGVFGIVGLVVLPFFTSTAPVDLVASGFFVALGAANAYAGRSRLRH